MGIVGQGLKEFQEVAMVQGCWQGYKFWRFRVFKVEMVVVHEVTMLVGKTRSFVILGPR